MTKFDEKLYGMFGYAVTTLIRKQNDVVLGKAVKKLCSKNEKQGLLLFVVTGMTVDCHMSDQKLGGNIRYKSAFPDCSLVDLGAKIVITLETYPEQDEMLKALTGYNFNELVGMLEQYEADYERT